MSLETWITACRRRAVGALKKHSRPAINAFLARHSTVDDPVVFDPAQFPWAARL